MSAAEANNSINYRSFDNLENDFSYNGSRWTGLYIGTGGAYNYNKIKEISDEDYVSQGHTGGIGALVGYNLSLFGGITIGIETDIYYKKLNIKNVFPPDKSDKKYDLFANWQGSTRLKLGLAIDRLFPYFSYGVSYSNAKFSSMLEDVADLNINNYSGTAGLGLAYALNNNFIFQADYRRDFYADDSLSLDKIFAEKGKISRTADSISLSLAYKF